MYILGIFIGGDSVGQVTVIKKMLKMKSVLGEMLWRV